MYELIKPYISEILVGLFVLVGFAIGSLGAALHNYIDRINNTDYKMMLKKFDKKHGTNFSRYDSIN